MNNHYSLSQLSLIIKEIFSISLPDYLWVKGEISELNENRSGHCYLELIEKNEERIIARFRAIIWERTYKFLKPYFEQTTNTKLKAGINILVKVKVEYNELYGITLIISDIDPSYTLGNLELQRALVLQKLISDGVIDMNKQLEFPIVPQRIAVISSDTAAGYQDFIHQLENNNYGFKFEVKLFKAYMQGKEAEDSIIDSLDKINSEKFDVVVITRGGGSRSDLACFDTYNLAFHICQFPLPVISAIGHEKDVSVIDMVAHTRVKTPTAAANFIIENTLHFLNNILNVYENIIHYANQLFTNEEYKLQNAVKTLFNVKFVLSNLEHYFVNITNKIHRNSILQLELQKQNLSVLTQKLKTVSYFIEKNESIFNQYIFKIVEKCQLFVNKEKQKLDNIEKYIIASEPKNILKKGYSITKKNGVSLKSVLEVSSGDEVKTILYDGEFISYVK
jgi:exodeoxyribonuclease VII large subunit